MSLITAKLTNYLVKSRFHAENWATLNKFLLDILNKNSIELNDFTNNRWKRLAHDFIKSGVWDHRPFEKFFKKISFNLICNICFF